MAPAAAEQVRLTRVLFCRKDVIFDTKYARYSVLQFFSSCLEFECFANAVNDILHNPNHRISVRVSCKHKIESGERTL